MPRPTSEEANSVSSDGHEPRPHRADPPAELAPQDVVLRFLESTGRPSEARLYLDLFHARPREQFAAIAIDANVMSDAADAVVQDLRFLAALDLFPTVVLGIFQPADAAAHARVLSRHLERRGRRDRGAGRGRAGPRRARHGRAPRRGACPPSSSSRPAGEQPGRPARATGRSPPGAPDAQAPLPPPPRRSAAGRRPRPAREPHDRRPRARREQGDLAQGGAHPRARAPALRGGGAAPLHGRDHVAAEPPPRALHGQGRGHAPAPRRAHRAPRGLGRRRPAAPEGAPRVELRAGPARGLLRGRRPAASTSRRTTAAARSSWTRRSARTSRSSRSRRRRRARASRGTSGRRSRRTRPSSSGARGGRIPISEWYVKLCDGLVRVPDWTVYWKGLAAEAIPAAIDWAVRQPVDIPREGE